MTIPAHEMRSNSSWRGLFDKVMRVCDKYNLPCVFPQCELLMFIDNGKVEIFYPEEHQWLN